jgi:hypothetical protein
MKDAWNLLVRVRETVISTNLPSLNQIEGIWFLNRSPESESLVQDLDFVLNVIQTIKIANCGRIDSMVGRSDVLTLISLFLRLTGSRRTFWLQCISCRAKSLTGEGCGVSAEQWQSESSIEGGEIDTWDEPSHNIGRMNQTLKTEIVQKWIREKIPKWQYRRNADILRRRVVHFSEVPADLESRILATFSGLPHHDRLRYMWRYKCVREFKCVRLIGWKSWRQTKDSRFTQDPEFFSMFWNHIKVDKDHTHFSYKLLWLIRV